MKQPAVYIVTNKKEGTLYIGVTSHLEQRIYQHRQGEIEGFAQKYKCNMLVYYDLFQTMSDAISAEKKLKKKLRKGKISLIEQNNPHWNDLYEKF